MLKGKSVNTGEGLPGGRGQTVDMLEDKVEPDVLWVVQTVPALGETRHTEGHWRKVGGLPGRVGTGS